MMSRIGGASALWLGQRRYPAASLTLPRSVVLQKYIREGLTIEDAVAQTAAEAGDRFEGHTAIALERNRDDIDQTKLALGENISGFVLKRAKVNLG
jgi:hypothetical protein